MYTYGLYSYIAIKSYVCMYACMYTCMYTILTCSTEVIVGFTGAGPREQHRHFQHLTGSLAETLLTYFTDDSAYFMH